MLSPLLFLLCLTPSDFGLLDFSFGGEVQCVAAISCRVPYSGCSELSDWWLEHRFDLIMQEGSSTQGVRSIVQCTSLTAVVYAICHDIAVFQCQMLWSCSMASTGLHCACKALPRLPTAVKSSCPTTCTPLYVQI